MAADTYSFDSSESTDLFCNEQSHQPLCFDDDHQNDVIFGNGGSDSHPFINHFPSLTQESIAFMLQREADHLPRHDYLNRFRNGDLNIRLRKDALNWMFKACAHFSFGELCLYSATTYLDRFLSIYEFPISSLQKGGENWAIQLVAVACLSIAAKIEEVNVPSTLDLQAGLHQLLFEGKTISRMEIMVLSSLKWKVKAYTPCNYIDYYLRKLNDDKSPPRNEITRSLQIILSTIEGIEFLEFKPSEIAASVAMYVSREKQAMDIDVALSLLIGVEKERLMKCLELIQDLEPIDATTTTAATTATTINSVISSLLPHSPSGIIEAACLSYKRDEREGSPETKRRRLDQRATLG